MLVGIRHSGFIVSDIGVSRHFYEEILGFEGNQAFEDNSSYINDITGTSGANVTMVKMKSPDGSVVEILSYGGEVAPTVKPKVPIYNVGEAHLAIQVSDIDAYHDLLVSKDVPILSRPIVSSEGFAKVFFCLDPDDYRIEVVEIFDD